MSDYNPPDEILPIFNVNNYTYNDVPLTVQDGNDLYYERNGRIVQSRTNWGGGPSIANGAICTLTSNHSTWCLQRGATDRDASINFYTAGALSYRWGINTTPFETATGVFSLMNSANARIAFFDNNGNLNISGTLTQASDRDVKKDIQDNTLGLDFINKLQTKTYRMKVDADDSPLRYGLIFQELEELCNSENVSFSGLVETEGTKAISYIELIAPLIKSLQELTTQVKELTERVKQLEGV